MARKKTQYIPKRSGLRRRLITTGLILLILYIGAHILSRTEGIRSLVADKISNGTRVPVSLEACGATPLLGLRLKGLLIQGANLPDVKLSFNWLAWLSKEKPFVSRLQLKDAAVSFRQVPSTGNWEPLVLQGVASRIGAVMGVNKDQSEADGELPVFPPYAINAKTRLLVSNTYVEWQDDNGRVMASIENADCKVGVKRFNKRQVVQTVVECDRITLASKRVLEEFRMETVHVEGSSWITVLEMSDIEGQYPEFATPTLWQDLNRQLNQLSDVR